MTKKAKIVIAAIIFVLLIIVVLIAYMISNTAKIHKTDFTFEYGQKVKITSEDIFGKNVNADINLSAISNEVGKNYPGIGEYTGTVKYNHVTSDLTVKVVDTKKPKFTKAPSKVELVLFDGTHSFRQDFKAKDVSEVKYSFETGEVRFDQNGTYHAVAIATDSSGNTTKKKFKVIVGTGIDDTLQQDTNDLSANSLPADSSTETTKKKSKKKKNSTTTKDAGTSDPTVNSTTSGSYSSGYYDAYGGYTDAYGNYWPANIPQNTQENTSGSGYSGNDDDSGYSVDAYGNY